MSTPLHVLRACAVPLLVACAPAPEQEPHAAASADAGVPFAVEVVAFSPGPGAGFGADGLPGVVLGPPRGGGGSQGGLDVLSLGHGGSITLRLGVVAVDGAGADLLVFENAFRVTGGGGYVEPAEVSVSADGVTWVTFPCTPANQPPLGCAGVTPTYAPGPDGGIDPTDPLVSGGDAFDLAAVGVSRASFVRIRDLGLLPAAGSTSGFDLDAVAVTRSARGW